MGALIPLESRARTAIIWLVLAAVANGLTIVVDWLDMDLMSRLIRGDDVSQGDLDASDTRQALAWVAYLGTLIGGAIFFIRWFHPAYKNLRVLNQPNLRVGTGWAIGGWFVPILSLWRPKQIANDIWRGSDPNAPPGLTGSAWKDRPVPALLGLWWAAWILASFLGNFVGRLWLEGDSPSDVRRADRADLASSVVEIIGAVLAIMVIRLLTQRQGEKAARLAQDTPDDAPAIYGDYLRPEPGPEPPTRT